MSPVTLKMNVRMFKQIRRMIAMSVLVAFVVTSIKSPAYAQVATESPMPWMPKPGEMVALSPTFSPAHLTGMVIHPDNGLEFDFLIRRGDQALSNDQKQEEYKKLIKYFLASLAVPDDNQWVNLSPYEKNRIIKDDFGLTEMGRDLLAQDYILKQITASLIYPEKGLGKKFWDTVFTQAQQQYGTTSIPVNTFNKVWIVPDQALVYEKGNTVYVIKNHLKVMLEEDYLSLQKHTGIETKKSSAVKVDAQEVNKIGSKVVREIVLPALEKEVNEGKNFAILRQIYSGMILAAWYKKALKESLLGKIYANKTALKGIDQNPQSNQEIYHRYLQAYKKGVFNFIKDDVDKYSKEIIPRKYFSGGALNKYDTALVVTKNTAIGDSALITGLPLDDKAAISLREIVGDFVKALTPLSWTARKEMDQSLAEMNASDPTRQRVEKELSKRTNGSRTGLMSGMATLAQGLKGFLKGTVSSSPSTPFDRSVLYLATVAKEHAETTDRPFIANKMLEALTLQRGLQSDPQRVLSELVYKFSFLIEEGLGNAEGFAGHYLEIQSFFGALDIDTDKTIDFFTAKEALKKNTVFVKGNNIDAIHDRDKLISTARDLNQQGIAEKLRNWPTAINRNPKAGEGKANSIYRMIFFRNNDSRTAIDAELHRRGSSLDQLVRDVSKVVGAGLSGSSEIPGYPKLWLAVNNLRITVENKLAVERGRETANLTFLRNQIVQLVGTQRSLVKGDLDSILSELVNKLTFLAQEGVGNPQGFSEHYLEIGHFLNVWGSLNVYATDFYSAKMRLQIDIEKEMRDLKQEEKDTIKPVVTAFNYIHSRDELIAFSQGKDDTDIIRKLKNWPALVKEWKAQGHDMNIFGDVDSAMKTTEIAIGASSIEKTVVQSVNDVDVGNILTRVGNNPQAVPYTSDLKARAKVLNQMLNGTEPLLTRDTTSNSVRLTETGITNFESYLNSQDSLSKEDREAMISVFRDSLPVELVANTTAVEIVRGNISSKRSFWPWLLGAVALGIAAWGLNKRMNDLQEGLNRTNEKLLVLREKSTVDSRVFSEFLMGQRKFYERALEKAQREVAEAKRKAELAQREAQNRVKPQVTYVFNDNRITQVTIKNETTNNNTTVNPTTVIVIPVETESTAPAQMKVSPATQASMEATVSAYTNQFPSTNLGGATVRKLGGSGFENMDKEIKFTIYKILSEKYPNDKDRVAKEAQNFGITPTMLEEFRNENRRAKYELHGRPVLKAMLEAYKNAVDPAVQKSILNAGGIKEDLARQYAQGGVFDTYVPGIQIHDNEETEDYFKKANLEERERMMKSQGLNQNFLNRMMARELGKNKLSKMNTKELALLHDIYVLSTEEGRKDIVAQYGEVSDQWKNDAKAHDNAALGGIDLNSANLDLQIRRDGQGVPLPISQQNWEKIRIDGLLPEIMSIVPAVATPIFSQAQGATQAAA